MSRITYLTSGQPKPCSKDTRPLHAKYIFRAICTVCGNASYALKGPCFLCLGCFLDIKAKIRRHG